MYFKLYYQGGLPRALKAMSLMYTAPLRSINPSPYLFYFDYGNFKLFGSSPEAQIQIKNGKGHIFRLRVRFADRVTIRKMLC
jgi:anthranilate/para-aminobenzoate synthase component I